MPNQPINSYLLINFSMFFHFVDYTPLLGLIGKVINVLATFAWSFNDIFVMAVSVSLAARFRQLNDHMLREARLVGNQRNVEYINMQTDTFDSNFLFSRLVLSSGYKIGLAFAISASCAPSWMMPYQL